MSILSTIAEKIKPTQAGSQESSPTGQPPTATLTETQNKKNNLQVLETILEEVKKISGIIATGEAKEGPKPKRVEEIKTKPLAKRVEKPAEETAKKDAEKVAKKPTRKKKKEPAPSPFIKSAEAPVSAAPAEAPAPPPPKEDKKGILDGLIETLKSLFLPIIAAGGIGAFLSGMFTMILEGLGMGEKGGFFDTLMTTVKTITKPIIWTFENVIKPVATVILTAVKEFVLGIGLAWDEAKLMLMGDNLVAEGIRTLFGIKVDKKEKEELEKRVYDARMRKEQRMAGYVEAVTGRRPVEVPIQAYRKPTPTVTEPAPTPTATVAAAPPPPVTRAPAPTPTPAAAPTAAPAVAPPPAAAGAAAAGEVKPSGGGKFNSPDDFAKALFPYAEKVSKMIGGKVPPIAILGQWAGESGSGKSLPADFNYAGIKAGKQFEKGDYVLTEERYTDAQLEAAKKSGETLHRVLGPDDKMQKKGRQVTVDEWFGKGMWQAARNEGKNWVQVKSYFAKFKDIDDFATSFAKFISTPRYAKAREQTTAAGFGYEIAKAGYATASAEKYSAKIVSFEQQYGGKLSSTGGTMVAQGPTTGQAINTASAEVGSEKARSRQPTVNVTYVDATKVTTATKTVYS